MLNIFFGGGGGLVVWFPKATGGVDNKGDISPLIHSTERKGMFVSRYIFF